MTSLGIICRDRDSRKNECRESLGFTCRGLFYTTYKELALGSRGRVDGSHAGGPRFDPLVSLKLFTIS